MNELLIELKKKLNQEEDINISVLPNYNKRIIEKFLDEIKLNCISNKRRLT